MWQMSAIPVAESALSFASGTSACYAAFYWFKSTKVPIASSLAGVNTHSGFGEPVVYIPTDALAGPLRISSMLNRKAALWSAISATFVALSAVPQIIESLNKPPITWW